MKALTLAIPVLQRNGLGYAQKYNDDSNKNNKTYRLLSGNHGVDVE
jgi:hypothetical protein